MKIGYCLTGSFCTFAKSLEALEALVRAGHTITPIMSQTAYTTDTRFGDAVDIQNRLIAITGNSIIHTIAAKSHLRNDAPVVIGVSTNDALGGAAKNIGQLLNYKHFYFVPFGMDNCYMKPKSMVCDFARVPQAIELAAQGQQIAEKIF